MPAKKVVTKQAKKTDKVTRTVRIGRKVFVLPSLQQVLSFLASPFVRFYRHLRTKRQNAIHKSFTRTLTRDKIRIPKVENIFAFTGYVFSTLWKRKFLYFRFIIVFVGLTMLVIGISESSNIELINSTIDSAGAGGNVIEPITRAAATVGASITGSLNTTLSEVQVLYVTASYIICMLCMVWLLRQQLAGNKVSVRDALYNAIAPILAEYVLVLVGIIQLIPLAIASLAYASALIGGWLGGGIETAMFSIALFLVIVLTLYYMTTTLFALFIASVQGTYPLKAYRVARMIVAGQRFRLLLRMLWLVVVLLAAWFMIMVPFVIVVNSLGAQNGLVIPAGFQIMVALSFVYGTAYMYLLYRRMIDEPVAER